MLSKALHKYDAFYKKFAPMMQDLFLLLIRIVWGYGFFRTGLGKFQNFEKTVGFFTELQIPLPKLNAALAAGTEMFGGLLLLVGLGSRIVPVPLIFTMIVAYSTAHTKQLAALLSFPKIDEFLKAPPFLFMYAAIIVLLFGAGRLSLDELLGKKRKA